VGDRDAQDEDDGVIGVEDAGVRMPVAVRDGALVCMSSVRW
jgi:hypothetical protein